MAKPFIAVTTDYVTGKPHYMLPWTYCEAVEKAGGLPVMLPYKSDVSLVSEYVDQFDGFVLAGGDDIDPVLYGETYHAEAHPVDPDRQKFEFALLAEIEKRRAPVLGICLGSQVMNVSRGGSLYQFLPELKLPGGLEHRRLEDWGRRHSVVLEGDSHLARAIGSREIVSNTSHKQAVHQLGRGLKITARAPDGVIEGTEDPSLPFYVGVQWHPERQNGEADHLAIFKALMAAAGK